MKKCFYFTMFHVILLSSSNYCIGQSFVESYFIYGNIVDYNTQKPINGVLINVDNDKASIISDSLGFYKFSLPKSADSLTPYTIKYFISGYKQIIKKVFLYTNKEINLDFEETTSSLKEKIIAKKEPSKPIKSNFNTFTISGTITDINSGKPILGVYISVDYKNIGILTDSLGRYSLNLPPSNRNSLPYLLKFNYVGYKALREKVYLRKNETINFELEEITKTLEEVVVSSQTAVKNINTPSLGISILNMKGIKKIPAMMGEVDIIRSIQLLPGVSSVGEGSNGINVRGGAIDQNLIFIDDAPVMNPTHLFGLFSVFASDAIRELELYKGSIPARFGGGIASVMNIKMVEPNLEKLKVNGGIGIIANRLMVEVPIIKDKLSIMAATRLSFNDFLFKLIDVNNARNTRANFYDVATKVLYRPNKNNTFSFSSYFSNDYYQVDSLFSISNVIARKTSFRYGHQNFSSQLSHYFNTKLSMNITAVYANYKTNTFSPDSINEISLKNSVLYKNLKLNFDYNPNVNHKINFGLRSVSYNISPGTLNKNITSRILPVLLPKEQALEIAAFVDDEFSISKKLSIQAGLRFVKYYNLGPYSKRIYAEDTPPSENTIINTKKINSGEIEQSYAGFEPRFALKYSISENTAIKFGYNRMQQFIQILSNNTTPLPTARFKTADSFIKPQIGDFVSLGFFKNIKENIYEFSSEMYYRKTENLIDFISGTNLQLNKSVETQLINSVGKAYGLELMLTKKRGEVTGWLSYTYARSFQKTTSNFPDLQQIAENNWYPSNFDKPHAFNFVINSHPHPIHDFGLTFTYSTGRPFTSPSGIINFGNKVFPVYDSRNNSRIPDYHRLDFSWTMDNPAERKGKFKDSWVFTIYNIYGRNNAYSVFFRSESDKIKPYILSVFAAPIGSVTYNFKF